MKFEIKNRWTGDVKFTAEIDATDATPLSVRKGLAVKWALANKIPLRGSDLSCSDLRGCDLCDSDLRGSKLSDADLSDSDLSYSNLSACDLRDSDLCDSDLSGSNLRDSDLRDSNLSGANLSGSILIDANLSGCDLSGCDLRDSDLRGSDLSGSNLTPIKNDFWIVLRAAINEVPALRQALVEGRVDGSTYNGDCACLVGTIANARRCDYEAIEGLTPDSSRPIERFFLAITKGSTPENNSFSKLAVEWLDEFVALTK